MKTDTEHKVLEYIEQNKQATAFELVNYLNISRQAVFKQLKKLNLQNKLVKIGKPPKVYYILATNIGEWFQEARGNTTNVQLSEEQKRIIDNNYLYVSSFGHIYKGMDGFVHWCVNTKQPIEKTAIEYIKTLKKYAAYRNKDGLLDGMKKMKNSFKTVYLDSVFYLDFYSIERFGKTKLGKMLLYAKQSQNKTLIKQLTLEIKPQVQKIILQYNIDGVGFIPPTIKREVQLMSVLAKQLDIKQEIISINKVINDVAVPQKTLTKIDERITNARNTIYVTERKKFENILLIDDAVGSGATLNETAKKIRAQNLCTGKIIGLALTGSYKGFDVISEV
ncbi:MAG: phosphoribosyltransferase family protein [Patescibacteria group bacterium]